MVPSGRIALICGSTYCTDVGVFSACGNLHSLVSGSLYPVRIFFPSFFSCTLCFVNVTVHMLSHITGIDMKGSWMLSTLYDFSPVMVAHPSSVGTGCALGSCSHLAAGPYRFYYFFVVAWTIHSQTV